MVFFLKKAKADNWIGLKSFTTTTTKIGVPVDRHNNRVTGLKDKAEEEAMEEKMGLPKGTLSKKSDFWDTFHISVDQNALRLDTESPDDELKYKALCARKDVAPNISALKTTHVGAEFVLYCEENEAEEENKVLGAKPEAYRIYSDLAPADKRQILLLYGKNPDTVSDAVVDNHILKELDKDPSKFVRLLKSSDLKNKIFIQELRFYGVLSTKGAAYYRLDEHLADTEEGLIAFLKDKKNNNYLIGLKETLKEAKRLG